MARQPLTFFASPKKVSKERRPRCHCPSGSQLCKTKNGKASKLASLKQRSFLIHFLPCTNGSSPAEFLVQKQLQHQYQHQHQLNINSTSTQHQKPLRLVSGWCLAFRSFPQAGGRLGWGSNGQNYPCLYFDRHTPILAFPLRGEGTRFGNVELMGNHHHLHENQVKSIQFTLFPSSPKGR